MSFETQFIHKFKSSKFNEWVLLQFQDPDASNTINMELTDYNDCKPFVQRKWNKVSVENEVIINGARFSIQINNSINLSLFDKLNFCLNANRGTKIEIFLMIGEYKQIIKKFQATGLREEVLVDISAKIKKHNPSGLGFNCVLEDNQSPVNLDLNWVSGIILNHDAELTYAERNIEDLFKNKINFENHSFVKDMVSDYKSFNDVREKITCEPYSSLFEEMKTTAESYLSIDLTAQQHEYIPGYDNRFIRVHERNRETFHKTALTLGFVGLVLKDQKYIDKCWEFMVAIVDAPVWFSSAEENLKTSAWNARGFLPELTTCTLSILLDWFGKNMSISFYKATQKAIWEKGVSVCHSDILRFPYMKKMNQGPVFMRSLILGNIILENTWETSEIADKHYADFCEIVFSEKLLEKGEEGPVYLTQMLQAFLFSIICYSNARGLNLTKELKKFINPCLPYLKVLSGPTDGFFYAMGDSRKIHGSGDFFTIAAKLFPEDKWLNNVAYEVAKSGQAYLASGTLRNTGGILSLIYGPKKLIKNHNNRNESSWSRFNKLNIVRYDHRSIENDFDIVAIGGSNKKFHSHEDAGSFVFSLNGQSVFIDPGIVEYDNIEAVKFKSTLFHNLLAINVDGVIQKQKEIKFKKGRFSGFNNKTLTFELDGIYEGLETYSRIFKNINSNNFEVRDHGVLSKKSQVIFNIITPNIVEKVDNGVVIDLIDRRVKVEAKWAESTDITLLSTPIFEGDVHIIKISTFAEKQFDFLTKFKF